jgi:hypothetical protein
LAEAPASPDGSTSSAQESRSKQNITELKVRNLTRSCVMLCHRKLERRQVMRYSAHSVRIHGARRESRHGQPDAEESQHSSRRRIFRTAPVELAGIANAVMIAVGLVGVEHSWAVVAGVADTIGILIGLKAVWYQWAVINDVRTEVVIGVLQEPVAEC